MMNDEEKLEIATQALKDVLNPISMMRRNVPEGHDFNAGFVIQYADSPQCYKDIARDALTKIGIDVISRKLKPSEQRKR